MLSFLIFGPHNNHFTDEEMERSGSMVLLQMLMPTCPADRRESLPGSSRTSGGPDQAGWPALGCRPLQSWDRPLLLPGWPLERKCLFPCPKSPPSVILITALAEVRLTIPMAEMRKLRLREGSGLARPTRYSSANGGRVWLLQRGGGRGNASPPAADTPPFQLQLLLAPAACQQKEKHVSSLHPRQLRGTGEQSCQTHQDGLPRPPVSRLLLFEACFPGDSGKCPPSSSVLLGRVPALEFGAAQTQA